MKFILTFFELFMWLLYLVSPLLGILAIIITALGHVVSRLEKWGHLDGFYWSFITATTVGYGDIRPLRKSSRLLSIVIAIIGIMFTGIILSATLKTVTISLEMHIDPTMIERIQKEISD